MMSILFTKQLKNLKRILLIISFFPIIFTYSPTPANARLCKLWGCPIRDGMSKVGVEAARELSAAIEMVKNEGIPVEFGVDDKDLQTIFNRTQSLVGYTTLQGKALTTHFGKEYRNSLSLTMNELTDYTETLDEITEQRITQLDEASKNRIRQTLEGIERETLLISSEMTKQILAIDTAVKSSSSHISRNIQEITHTASDELKKILGITRAEVDYLLRVSEDRLLNILAATGDEFTEFVKLTSEEIQNNIRLIGDESQEFSIVTFNKFDEVAQSILEESGNQTQEATRVAANELRVVLSQIKGISKVLIADSAGHAIDITDNLSDETKEVIETGAKNLEYLASHVAQEVLTINEAVKESRLQVIEGGLFFIDRTADLILAIASTGAGILFLFTSSYGFTRAFLQHNLPNKYTQRIIVFSFMGSTIVASFVPFIFSIPSARARVLMPMGMTKSFAEVVGSIGGRIPREKTTFKNSLNNRNCYILATENVRSEPSSHQGYKTVITTGSKQNKVKLDVTGKQTPKGWLEVLTSEDKEAWVHKSVTSNYENMQDCLNDKDIEVTTVPDLIPPKPPTPKIKPPTRHAHSRDLSKEEATSVVKRWLDAKKEIFAPPFNRLLGAELTTGNAYDNWFIQPVDWLEKNSLYYTFGLQKINSVESFKLDKGIATISVLVTEERTFCNKNTPLKERTAFDQRLAHYTLKLKDGKWKIADFDSKPLWERENPNKSCPL